MDDEGWVRIERLVQEFNDHMVLFFILRSKKLENEIATYDFEKDSLLTQDAMRWWGVRGNRYSVHEILNIQELLLPHSDIFYSVFDFTIDEFIHQLEKIQYSLTFGLGDAVKELIDFQEESLNKIENSDIDIVDFDEEGNWLREAIEKVGLRQKADDVFEKAFGLTICNLTKITSLPINLMDELSWREGQDEDFWSKGKYAGWPLRVTPLRKRPFLNIQGQYYCFDLNNLFDNLYRVIERLIITKRPEIRETWNKSQKENSEALPFKYFAKLLPNAEVHRSVYYGKLGGRAEVDGLIIYDDVLLIVEVKAGALDAGSPILDYEPHLKKLQELIGNPATQANRFSKYLKENNQIKIYEGNSKTSRTITSLNSNAFRKIFQCTITLDNLTHLAAKASKLKPLGIDIQTLANWSLALDDLRVYSDIFESPLQFLHFLEQRELAQGSNLIELNDELDHLGFYLQKNNYALTAEEMMKGRKKPNFIVWDTFTGKIDEYYSKLLAEPNIKHQKPNQEMPSSIKEIVQVLEIQGKLGRVWAASHILNGSGEYRQQIEDGINFVLRRQKEVGRLNPFHIHGDMNTSVFCEQEGIKLPDSEWIKDYIISMLTEYKTDQSLVLFLKYDETLKLIDVGFSFISIADIVPSELARIKRETTTINRRLTRHKVDARKLRKGLINNPFKKS